MMILAGLLQVSSRSPLVWDEAARVSSGMQLAFALEDLDVGLLWEWFTVQDAYYPFFGHALHGLAYLFTGDALVAAWLPALAAYGAAGVLVGRLAFVLGAGTVGAWVAAFLFWIAPIEVKVAAGALTEPLGVCVEMGAILLLVRLDASRRRAFAIGLGAVLGLAWWVKYDYGLLTTGTVAVAALVRLATERRLGSVLPHAAAIAIGVAMFAVVILPGLPNKVDGLEAFLGKNAPGSAGAGFIGSPWSAEANVDFLYYPEVLFPPGGLVDLTPTGEIAFGTLFSLLLVGGVGWALLRMGSRPALRTPVIFVVLWLILYSLAVGKFPRYVATLVPILVVLATCAGAELWERVRGERGRLVALVAAGLLALQVALQLPRMGDQFAFFWPNPAASEALEFIGPRLPEAKSERWILMIGPTNELGANAVKIAWSEHLGRQAPGVDMVPEAARAERRQVVVEKLASMQPAQIVGVGIKSGSRLDSGDFRHTWPSQPDYYRGATALEREGLLRRLATTRSSDGALEITLWELSPGFAQRVDGP